MTLDSLSGLEIKTELYDLLVYTASWPDKRSQHWRALIPARAIENQAFVIGGQSCRDMMGNEVYYSGGSMCINPNGDVVYYKPEDEDLYTFTIYPKDLEENRDRFPFLDDQDQFKNPLNQLVFYKGVLRLLVE